MLEQPLNIPISKNKYKLAESYIYRDITVPKDFVYDGASVPRMLWSIIGLRPDGLIRAAATVHDWLYSTSGVTGSRSYTRAESDMIFYDLMVLAEISEGKCKVAYWAVKYFGKPSWGVQDN